MDDDCSAWDEGLGCLRIYPGTMLACMQCCTTVGVHAVCCAVQDAVLILCCAGFGAADFPASLSGGQPCSLLFLYIACMLGNVS